MLGHISFTKPEYVGLPYEGVHCDRCGYSFMGKRNPPIICPICLFPEKYGLGQPASHFDDDWQPEHAAETVTRCCEVCGADISHLRPQAVTCSPKCRKALSRKKTG